MFRTCSECPHLPRLTLTKQDWWRGTTPCQGEVQASALFWQYSMLTIFCRRITELVAQLQVGRPRTLKLTIVRQRDKLEIVFKVCHDFKLSSHVLTLLFCCSIFCVRTDQRPVIATFHTWTFYVTCIKRSGRCWTRVIGKPYSAFHNMTWVRMRMFVHSVKCKSKIYNI